MVGGWRGEGKWGGLGVGARGRDDRSRASRWWLVEWVGGWSVGGVDMIRGAVGRSRVEMWRLGGGVW